MASTVFVNGVTLSDEDFFNDINRLHYTIFSDPADVAAVKATLHASPGAIGSGTPSTGAFTTISASSTLAVTGTSTLTGLVTATAGGVNVSAVAALGNVHSLTYTPTLTNTTNIAASTAYVCQYMRVGNTVTVSGRVDIDPTATGATLLGISLPIASNLASAAECCGSASAVASTECFAINGDAANNRASLAGLAVDTANHDVYFQFTYLVI